MTFYHNYLTPRRPEGSPFRKLKGFAAGLSGYKFVESLLVQLLQPNLGNFDLTNSPP
jgi:hypothetical protein